MKSYLINILTIQVEIQIPNQDPRWTEKTFVSIKYKVENNDKFLLK